MQPASFTRQLCRQLTREDFERRYPHPWLVRALSDRELVAISISSFFEVSTVLPGTARLRARTLEPLTPGERLQHEYGRMALDPVVRASGPRDVPRVVVGRASSSDIVLAEPTVSKHHACLRRGDDGRWRINDLGSANGTRVDGHPVEREAGDTLVHCGSLVQFAAVRCEFLSSGAVYDALMRELRDGEGAPSP